MKTGRYVRLRHPNHDEIRSKLGRVAEVGLAQVGAKRTTLQLVAIEQVRLIRLLDLKEDDKVGVSQLEAAVRAWSHPGGHRYHRTVPSSPGSERRFLRRAIRWLRFVGLLEEPLVVRHSHASEVTAFATWMRTERGLSEETIRCHCSSINEFFDWLKVEGVLLPSVRIIDIDRAIAVKQARRHYSP